MENENNYELEQEMINEGVLIKHLKYKKEYSGQKTDNAVTKWKS